MHIRRVNTPNRNRTNHEVPTLSCAEAIFFFPAPVEDKVNSVDQTKQPQDKQQAA